MPRKVVELETGEIYHVFNRGVDKRNVFHDPEDYLRFYQSLLFFNNLEPVESIRLAKSKSKNIQTPVVEVLAYALVENHYHLILKQLVDQGISLFMKRLGVGYTGYYNEKYERSGVLFQGKFKRVHVSSDDQLRYLQAYVHENHAVHGLSRPEHLYQSSTLHMRGIAVSKIISETKPCYDYRSAELLAKDIYEDRSRLRSELFD